VSQSDEPRPEESDSASVNAEETPTEEATPDTTTEDADSAPAADSAGAGAGNRKVLLFAAAAVVVLVVAGVLVYLLTKDDSSATAGSPDVPTIQNSDSPSSVGPARPPGGVTATITAPTSSAGAAAGGEAGAAQDVAEQAAQAITAADLKTLGELSCDPSAVNPEDDTFPADAKVEVVGNPQVNGDTATVDVKVMIADAPPATVPMPLVKQDGRWCILN
jgi:hypothetical protein